MKNNLKKTLLLCLSFVLVAALAIGGTVAYLTSEDSDVNVMTLGNVKIEQHEYERVVENGAYKVENGSYVLKDFTQAKPLLPSAIPTNGPGWGWDTTLVDMSQVGSKGTVQVFKAGSNAQDKIVTVKNTGKSDAYVRTWIALEDPFTENRLGVNVGSSAYYEQTPWTTVEIDGVKYSVSCFTYKEALKPGEMSTPSLFQVYLNSKATNEDMELLGETYEILAFSQAVQAAGFDSADAALDAAFGDNTTANHPWTNGVKLPAVVSTAKALDAALISGGDAVLTEDLSFSSSDTTANSGYGATGVSVKGGTLDGNGNSLGINNWGTWDAAVHTTGGTIKNLTINSGMRGIFMGSATADVYIDNVVIDGTIYTFNSDGGDKNYGVYISNSTLNGWTSHSDVHKEVVYTNCNFGEGSGYAFCRPYGPTAFVGCEFEAGYEIEPRGAVTFENCTIGGVALTADNLATLVTNNIQNASVK